MIITLIILKMGRALSVDEKKDLVQFHHTNDRDFIYEGLNVNLVLAFLVDLRQCQQILVAS
jgi:hypothetical protein